MSKEGVEESEPWILLWYQLTKATRKAVVIEGKSGVPGVPAGLRFRLIGTPFGSSEAEEAAKPMSE